MKIYDPKCWYVIDEYRTDQNMIIYDMVIGETDGFETYDVTKKMSQLNYHNILLGKYNIKTIGDDIFLYDENDENIPFVPKMGYSYKKTKTREI